MATIEEQAAALQEVLAEELTAAVERNPELDQERIRGWIHAQLAQLQEERLVPPEQPPIEPRAEGSSQDEMDALDEIWRRALARFKGSAA